MVGLMERGGDEPSKVRLFLHWCRQKRDLLLVRGELPNPADTSCTLSTGLLARPTGAGTCHSTLQTVPSDRPPAGYQALGPPHLPVPSADLSVDEQRGRRAMNVARVLSVSPTFHKLLGEGAGHSWGIACVPSRPPAAPFLSPHLFTAQGLPVPPVLPRSHPHLGPSPACPLT